MKFFRVLRSALVSASLLGSAAFALDSDLAFLVTKAEKGNAIAQYNLGLAYAEGRGVPVDNLAAYVWLSLAIENGARGRALDTVVSRLSAAELDAARNRLAQHRTALGLKPAPVAGAAVPEPAAETPAAPAESATPTTNSASAASEQELAQARLDKQQLSTELAAAWKEADQLKAEVERLRAAAATPPPPPPDSEQLRRERDALSAKLTDLAGDVATLRADRERLAKLAAQAQKDYSDTRELSRAYQEQTRVSEMRVGELVRQSEQLKAELSRAQESIAALQAPRPAVEHPEFAQKTRELAAALAQLDELKQSNEQLRASLQRTADDQLSLQQKTEQAQVAALALGQELDAARTRLAALEKRPSAPTYPDLREQVATLQREIETLRQAAPAYPDLRSNVAELERELAAARAAAPAYPDTRARVTQLEQELAAARNAAPAYPDVRPQLAELERELAAARDRAPTYPDLRDQVAQLQSELTTARNAAPAYPDLRARVNELEQQLAVAQSPAAPAYPDLRERVRDLEAQVTALRDAGPAFPDLRGRVAELEQQLASATAAANARPAAPNYPDLRERAQSLEADLARATERATAAETRLTALARDMNAADAQVASLRSQLTRTETEATTAQREIEKLRAAGVQLETALADARAAQRPAAPAYPDLRSEVAQLQSELATARTAAPAYPDLRERVGELEGQVAALRDAAPAFPDLRNRVAELEQQLARASSRPNTPAYPDLRPRVNELEAQVAALRDAAPAYPDLRGRVTELSNELASTRRAVENATADSVAQGRRVADLRAELSVAQQALAQKPDTPAFPDLRDRVADLEQQLARATAARPAAPAYPDLTARVSQLESALATTRTQLEQAQQSPAPATAPTEDVDAGELARQLADAEGKLATALRGYSLLQKERDELQVRATKSAEELAAERDALTARLAASEDAARSAQADVARLTDSLAALQRSTSQTGTELASVRALLQQVQGSNAVLARENYDLKTALARDPSRGSVAGTPAAPSGTRTHTVAAGESLSRISQRYYGTPARWQEIFNANRDVVDPTGAIRVGTTLRIP